MSNTTIPLRWRTLLRSGLISSALLILLLLFAAALGNQLRCIQNAQTATAKLCLFLSALLCGHLNAKAREAKKLAAALLGELALLAALLPLCLLCGEAIFTLSILLDLLCLAFGAFAGALTVCRVGRRRRRKR